MSIWSKAVISTGNPNDVPQVYDVELGMLPSNKVLIKMLMAPINPSDKFQLASLYPEKKDILDFQVRDKDGNMKTISGFVGGMEGVAEVVQIGSDSSASQAANGELKVGDWVVPSTSGKFGTWANLVFASPEHLIALRNVEGLTPEQVGSIKVNASTSYRMLKDIVALNPGDYVIQNGANSGVGQVLIQLAKSWGYKTINVVRDRPDFAELEAFLKNLGADIIIKDTELDSENTKKLISSLDNPVRLAINCIGGDPAVKMSEHLCVGGTFVTYGAMSPQPLSISAISFIFQDLHFMGYWIAKWYNSNPKSKWVEMWDEIHQMFKNGSLSHQKMKALNWNSADDLLDTESLQILLILKP
ncbi:hypothetical protein BB561_006501 [Smittium simulii]|uniref:enoyl-[acyl-carrier-protein] reductase n=1 Tax=Smittium simulii TaxID=133385 RepID=A0A2T9Y3S7_9FUNG|nr:hypothetical protein BB561_006501 [Smittium simulii]